MVSMVQVVNTSHENIIHDAKLDYYGTTLASCSSDDSIRIFDVRDQNHVLKSVLKDHQGPVWQVSWAHPMYDSLLASCSYDKKVIIWHKQNDNWTKLHEYTGHDSSVNSVCWAPHEYGLMLACGSSDGSISILTHQGERWDVKRIRGAHTMGVNAVSWAPAISTEGFLMPQHGFNSDPASGGSPVIRRLVSGGCDSCVKIWREDPASKDWFEEACLQKHTDWVRDVAWADDLGLSRQKIASCSQDGAVMIWTQIHSPDAHNSGSAESWQPTLLHDFNDTVWQVSWSVTGNILAVSGGDNKVSLWKENLEGQWHCLSDINQQQGDLSISQ
jgi:protein transport protein SEC13